MTQIKVRSKPDELCEKLTALAMRLGPGAKMPTAREMSGFYGVSPTTLHVALGRIEAQGTISRKQGSGIFVSHSLPPAPKRSLALVYNYGYLRVSNHSPFWDVLLERAQQRAGDKTEEFHLHFALPGDRGVLLQNNLKAEVGGGTLHGILGVGLDRVSAEWIESQGVPFVAFAGPGRYRVSLDTENLIARGVEELARQGCQDIALWSPLARYEPDGNTGQSLTRTRAAYRVALGQLGMEFCEGRFNCPSDLALPGDATVCESNQEQGYRTAHEVFACSGASRPDGVVITDDLMAHGALVALDKLGVRPGHEVKIATHANRGSTILAGDQDLTLLEIDTVEIVDAMFNLLEMALTAEAPGQARVFIQPRLHAPNR